MPDPAIMGGIGSLADGFIAGNNARIARQQQQLEQEKYETYKQQLSATNAQKEEELENQRQNTAAQYYPAYYQENIDRQRDALAQRLAAQQGGSQPQPQTQAQQQPQDTSGPNAPAGHYGDGIIGSTNEDWANAMGAGVLNKPPGSGFIGQGSQFATVPSTNAQANPGHAPTLSHDTFSMQMARFNKGLQSEEATQNEIRNIEKGGGSAQETHDAQGLPHISNVKFGPKDAAEINNAQLHQYNDMRDKFNNSDLKKDADAAANAMNKITKLMGQPDANGEYNPGKKEQQAIMINLVKLDMGQQAAREGFFNKMEENPEIMSKWGDEIQMAKNGTLTKKTLHDNIRAASQLYQGHRQALDDYGSQVAQEARSHGVVPDFTNVKTGYASADKAADTFLKNVPTFAQDEQSGGFLNYVRGGLMNGSRGAPQSVAAPAHPQDAAAISWARSNPKDPRAAKILQANGVK